MTAMVTLQDVRKVPREEWPATSVYRVMTPYIELHSVTLRDDLPRVLSEMARGDFNQIPLMDGRRLLGLIHRSDVIRYIQMRQEMLPGVEGT